VKTTRIAAVLSLILIMLFAALMTLTTQVHATTGSPTWNITGSWDLAFYCTDGSSDAQGNTFYHHMDIASENQTTGALTGTGYWIGVQTGGNYTTGTPDYYVSPTAYMWELFPDSYVSGDSVHIHLYFTSGHGSDWTSTFDAPIDSNGVIVNGIWSDSANNAGTVSSYNGQATPYVVLTFPEGSTVEVSIVASLDPPIFTFDYGDSMFAPLLTLPPGAVQLPPLPGIVGFYYDISVSGSFSGQVQICVHYDPALLPPGTNEQDLRLFIGDPVDFNGDGTVNGQDIALMQKAIKSEYNLRYDLNHDGLVDKADLLIVKQFASQGLIVNHGRNGLSQARLPWMDITICVDTDNHMVCGATEYFSAFGIH
jgi:hypothetical protein